MIGLLVKATWILVAGFAASRILSRSAAGTRHILWAVTLGALVLLPAICGLLPALELGWLPNAAGPRPSATIHAAPALDSAPSPMSFRHGVGKPPRGIPTVPAASRGASWR